jgi:putative inorganic carbon (HCO3(-)) transporter
LSRSDWGALLFAVACGGVAAALAFADYLPTRASAIVVGGLAALFLARGVATRTLLPHSVADWPNLATLLLLPVGLLISADRTLSWAVTCKILGGLAVFYGLAGLARTRWLLSFPWLMLVASIGFTAFVALSTAWPTTKMPFAPAGLVQALPRLALPGAEDSGFNPNIAGGALAMLLPPAVALALWGRGRWLRLAAALTAGGIGAGLLLSQSRGAWLAAAAALAIMPGFRHRRWWLVVAGAALLGVMGILLAGPDRLAQALFPAIGVSETALNTLNGRLELWSRALYLIQDFSFTGAGPGMFQRVVNLLYPLFLAGPDADIPHAHNVFLQAAVDLGIPGLIAYSALLLALAGALVAALRRSGCGTLPALAAGLLAALLVTVFHGLIDAPLYASQRTYILAAAVFGVAAALSEYLLLVSRRQADE